MEDRRSAGPRRGESGGPAAKATVPRQRRHQPGPGQGSLDIGAAGQPVDAGPDRADLVAQLIDVILDIATTRGRVTADDARDDPRTPTGIAPSDWGRAFSAAARTGAIRLSGGWIRSARPSRRRGVAAVWVLARRGGDR